MLSFQLIKKLHRSYYILLYKIWKNIYPRERLTRFEKKAFFLTWNIKEILNHWIIESCRSFYLFIYLFSFWENNFSFPIHRQKLIVSKLRYKRTITQIRISNLNHRSRIGNRSKLPSKKKKSKWWQTRNRVRGGFFARGGEGEGSTEESAPGSNCGLAKGGCYLDGGGTGTGLKSRRYLLSTAVTSFNSYQFHGHTSLPVDTMVTSGGSGHGLGLPSTRTINILLCARKKYTGHPWKPARRCRYLPREDGPMRGPRSTLGDKCVCVCVRVRAYINFVEEECLLSIQTWSLI